MTKDRDFTSRHPEREPCPGDLLVAAPRMDDPIFGRSVIYIIQHSLEGTLGVMLTRPGPTPIAQVLAAWEGITAEPRTFFYGGPVRREAGIALAVAKRGTTVDDSVQIHNIESRVYVIDLDSDPAELAESVEGVRIFAGYSSWAPGQLAAELSGGDWLVVPSLPADVLAARWVDLWAEVMRRQEMPLRLYATYPDDPELN